MKAETDPITDDEWLFRRVRIQQFRAGKVPRVSPTAFEPRILGRDPDHDGISLYRAACLADPSEVFATIQPDRWCEYGIVRIPVSWLRSQNLSVKIAPDNRVKGHVVIPELNAHDYKSNKSSFAVIKLALATLASEDENIVLWPNVP